MDMRSEQSLIPDRGTDSRKKHNLADILLLCVAAFVCGVQDVENIVFFGKTHKPRLRKCLELPNEPSRVGVVLWALAGMGRRKFEARFIHGQGGISKSERETVRL
jgi:hypothetical protein